MKYKAVMVMLGVCPTYRGNTIDEALEKAANDCWIENHVGKGWVFAEPEEDWKKYEFSQFFVFNTETGKVVMSLYNPTVVETEQGE